MTTPPASVLATGTAIGLSITTTGRLQADVAMDAAGSIVTTSDGLWLPGGAAGMRVVRNANQQVTTNPADVFWDVTTRDDYSWVSGIATLSVAITVLNPDPVDMLYLVAGQWLWQQLQNTSLEVFASLGCDAPAEMVNAATRTAISLGGTVIASPQVAVSSVSGVLGALNATTTHCVGAIMRVPARGSTLLRMQVWHDDDHAVGGVFGTGWMSVHQLKDAR
jgi:hypothetical protein